MDDYEKVKVVGRGAFGTVYLCRRRRRSKGHLQSHVIVKQIPLDQLSSLDRQATLNEVKVLSMLHHPNIVEYHDSFVDANKAMSIVMEHAAGGNLFHFLEERQREGRYLSEPEVGHLFAQMALPLQLVHDRHVLHRDLKSQNIFLTSSRDHVKIGDFGISKILSSKSKAYSVVGTPCYISPELCEGKPYNQKSDVWAMGCVLYEMCTLKRAFEAPTLPALVLKILRGSFPPLPPERYSAGLRQLLSMTLALEPADRPSVHQMLSHPWLSAHACRLPACLGGLPCTAKPPRPLSASSSFVAPHSPLLRRRVRSISPFQREPDAQVTVWEAADEAEHKHERLRLPSSSHNITGVCAVANDRVLAVTGEGRAVEWRRQKLQRWASPRFIDGLSGITITHVVASGSTQPEYFFCVLTDRGILLTAGAGAGGRLGHGDDRDVATPRIVEAMLGEQVVAVACGQQHVVAVTSDGNALGWGRLLCLGVVARSPTSSPISANPKKLDVGGVDVVGAACGSEGTLLWAREGGTLWAAGKRRWGGRGRADGGGGWSDGFYAIDDASAGVQKADFAGKFVVVVLDTTGALRCHTSKEDSHRKLCGGVRDFSSSEAGVAWLEGGGKTLTFMKLASDGQGMAKEGKMLMKVDPSDDKVDNWKGGVSLADSGTAVAFL